MIEVTRLKARVGGFVKYTDKADIYHPDPISTHFIGGKSALARYLYLKRPTGSTRTSLSPIGRHGRRT